MEKGMAAERADEEVAETIDEVPLPAAGTAGATAVAGVAGTALELEPDAASEEDVNPWLGPGVSPWAESAGRNADETEAEGAADDEAEEDEPQPLPATGRAAPVQRPRGAGPAASAGSTDAAPSAEVAPAEETGQGPRITLPDELDVDPSVSGIGHPPPGIEVAPGQPDVVPEWQPFGLRKYVYIKGVGTLRWDELDREEKEYYLDKYPDMPDPDAIRPPRFAPEPVPPPPDPDPPPPEETVL